MKLNLQNRLLNLLNIRILTLLTLPIILLDELTKIIAQRYFAVSCNPGIAFGIGEETEGKIAALIALLIIFVLLLQSKENKIRIGFALVFAGGLANFVDRVLWACVRDFIAISIFPSFNLADIVISLGLVLIFYTIFVSRQNGIRDENDSNS